MKLYREVDNDKSSLVAVVNDGYWSDSVANIEPIEITDNIESLKLKWQKHNRDNGLSWNEVAELVNQVALTRPTVSEEEIEKVFDLHSQKTATFRYMKFSNFKAATKELNR